MVKFDMINLGSEISYPLRFLIELNYSTEELTLFNLLSKDWIGTDFAIQMAALLPCSSIDFNYGWISPKHSASLMPVINYYYQSNVDEIKSIERYKATTKIFFASEYFSIDFINTITIRKWPSIVITSNDDYIDKLNNCHIVSINGKPKKEIIKEFYYFILEIFKNRKTFNGNNLEIDDFKETYLFEKKFLPQIEITANLLCTANEIVSNRVRGKLPKYLSFGESKILKLEECYKKNIDLTYDSISERFLDMYLGLKSADLKFPIELPEYFDAKINYFLKNQDRLSEYNNERIYNSLKNDITNFKNFDANEEIVIVIPSVNDFCRGVLFEKLLSVYGEEFRREIKDLINALLSGGKEIPFPIPEKRETEFIDLSKRLGQTRKAENEFLTSIAGLYASCKLSPILKTATVPSQLFTKMRILREKTTSSLLNNRHKNEDDYKTISEYFNDIQIKMSENFPSMYHEVLTDINVNKYTIFSDLPFELMILNDNNVFCNNYHVTRIPLTPLRFLLDYYNHYAIGPAFSIILSSNEEILLINSIPENDPLIREYKIFEDVCKDIGLNLTFISVDDSKEFISYINKNNPPILIYFGHAAYDVENDKGYLQFKNDRLSFEQLNEIEKFPYVVCLIGCETASSAAFSGGLSNHFLKHGTRAVLATLFPIPADHAGSFIGRLLVTIDKAKRLEKKHSLAKIIFEVRKIGWLMDRLDSLYRNGFITRLEQANILKEMTEAITILDQEREKGITTLEAEPIFEQVLQKYDVFNDWKDVESQTVYYSLFFTLLGNAHDIFFTE